MNAFWAAVSSPIAATACGRSDTRSPGGGPDGSRSVGLSSVPGAAQCGDSPCQVRAAPPSRKPELQSDTGQARDGFRSRLRVRPGSLKWDLGCESRQSRGSVFGHAQECLSVPIPAPWAIMPLLHGVLNALGFSFLKASPLAQVGFERLRLKEVSACPSHPGTGQGWRAHLAFPDTVHASPRLPGGCSKYTPHVPTCDLAWGLPPGLPWRSQARWWEGCAGSKEGAQGGPREGLGDSFAPPGLHPPLPGTR